MISPNREARKSVRLVSVELGFTVVIQFLSGIALARMLHPRDFGLFGITFTVFSLAGLFTDWGTKQRLIQSRDEPDARTLKVALTSRLMLCALVVPLVWIFSTRIAAIAPAAKERNGSAASTCSPLPARGADPIAQAVGTWTISGKRQHEHGSSRGMWRITAACQFLPVVP